MYMWNQLGTSMKGQILEVFCSRLPKYLEGWVIAAESTDCLSAMYVFIYEEQDGTNHS